MKQILFSDSTKSIECKFEPIFNSPESGKRFGRYSQSVYSDIKGFEINKWVILAYILVEWVALKEQMTEIQIFQSCLNYLNNQKDNKGKSIYGFLESYKADFKNKNGKQYIIAQMISDQRKNINFWCEGLKG